MTDKKNGIEELFMKLNADNAPGQESRQKNQDLKLIGDKIEGEYVDFSHGDVDAHEPIPGVLDHYIDGFNTGGSQAYTEYRGQAELLKETAKKLSNFTGADISPDDELIITPGTQGALFLALGATVTHGDKVAIVEPDYFANRKLVHFFHGEVVPVQMDYLNHDDKAGIDLTELEQAFKDGAKVFLFSNPNNPSGAIYSNEEINQIAELVSKYGVTVIADELYSRQLFDNREYTHLIAHPAVDRSKIITIIGPSKTESLSGFRLGAGFGSSEIIDRMEQLQAIVSLRASGYSQAALKSWFSEPEGWMAERIAAHQAIRDDLVTLFRDAGYKVRLTEAGSYVFPQAQNLSIDDVQIAKILREQANVAVTPGTEFAPYCTNSFRLNFSQDHGKAVDAVKRIIKVLENYKNG